MSDEKTPERGYRAEHSYKGTKLKPFAFVRLSAAQEMGWKLPNISDDEWSERRNPKWVELQAIISAMDEDTETITEMGGIASLEERRRELEGEPETIRSYPGFLRDAVIIVWLCLQPDSVCQRAERKPDEAVAKMNKWADAEGITMKGEGVEAVMDAYSDILSDYFASQSEPKLDEENDDDPN